MVCPYFSVVMAADPFGHQWAISQHLTDMTPEEMKKAQDEFFAQMAQKK